MKRRAVPRLLRGMVVTIVMVGVAAPQMTLLAAEPGFAWPVVPVPAERIADISLGEGGTLRGDVLDGTGRPLAGKPVMVHGAESLIESVTTDARGRFSVAGLHSGVYQVVSGGAGKMVRLWTPGASPPAAEQSLRLVSGPVTVRGQREPGPMLSWYERAKRWLADPFVVGGIVAAAVAVPIIVHNANQDKDSGS